MASLRYGEELVLRANALSGHRDPWIFVINSASIPLAMRVEKQMELKGADISSCTCSINFKSTERYLIGIVKSAEGSAANFYSNSYTLCDNYGQLYSISHRHSDGRWIGGECSHIYTGNPIFINEPNAKHVHSSLSTPLPECVIDHIKEQYKKGNQVDTIGLLSSSIMKSQAILSDTNETLKSEISTLKLEHTSNLFEYTIQISELQAQLAVLQGKYDKLQTKYDTDSQCYISAITTLNNRTLTK